MSGIALKNIKYTKDKRKDNTFLADVMAILNKDISFSGLKLSDKQKEYFYLELNILLAAGVDIKTALELIILGQQQKKAKSIINIVKDKVISGSSISEAMVTSNFFSAYEYFSVQIGEETGKLPIVLKELSTYYQKKIKQRRQIVSALSYPVIVLLTSFGAILFMIGYIVPLFADVFQRSGGQLPYITAIIIKLSTFISSYFYLFVLLILGIIGGRYKFRKHVVFRDVSSRILLRVPILGSIIQKIYLARFCQSMALLVGARVPILRALTMVKQMIGFYPIESSLSKVEDSVLKGASLHQSFESFTIYPTKMIMLLRVGEEVNKLEFFFNMINEQYNDEVEYQTGIISSMLEPIIIILLGLVVGVILIAMYLPLFKLGAGF